jgi:hypothetical protein
MAFVASIKFYIKADRINESFTANMQQILYEQATIVEVSNFGKKFKEDKQEVNT